ncbi:class I SAM-dependent DNA methyltransferase [Nocardia altamirensis]|uniref:class I SAM-dependent DNA methyltransferase n=1 Tax=Nocardia altamirensis TaxID=472158 RepID=UPI00083FF342|nr:class I SAM-dependent methyltransferase [Nocardia altamirensis]
MVENPSAPADVHTTRQAYNEIAAVYTEFVKGHLDTAPFDRAMLSVFAERVRAGGSGSVADIGCGEGRITAHLNALGVPAFGIDLAPELLAIARQQYPELSFDEGSMEQLALGDGSLAGLVVWYSMIHLPPERVPDVLNELYRVLAWEGHALLAFQATDVPDTVEAFDHKVTRAYRWSPERLAGLLRDAGFTVHAQLVREPEPDERFQQAYLLASKLR